MNEDRKNVIMAVILSVISLVGLGAVGAGLVMLGMEVSANADAQLKVDCRQDVQTVDNLRSMFLAVFEEFEGRPWVPQLRDDLDTLIPPLHCVDGVALPVDGAEADVP